MIFKNAILSILRTKSRNVLIGLIILAVTTASMAALTIKNSATKIIELQNEESQLEASLVIDRDSLRSSFDGSSESMKTLMASIPGITEDDLQSYANSTYVSALTYYLSVEDNSSTLYPVGTDVSLPSKDTGTSTRGQFTILGLIEPELYGEFVNGNYQMIDGSVFSLYEHPSNVLISEELALTNGLSIGDVFETDNFEFIVSGIYLDLTPESQNSTNWFSKSANQIIGNHAYISPIDETLNRQITHTFFLIEDTQPDLFLQELYDQGLNDYYTLVTNQEALNKAMEPLMNLSSFTSTFLILVLVVGGIILMVINMINIRERKYEIGVLRAIGMKKHMVASQFLIELVVVTIIFMGIGIGIGNLISEPVGNYMLQSEIQQLQNENEALEASLGTNSGGRGGLGRTSSIFTITDDIDFIKNISYKVDTAVVLQLICIGLIIVVLGSLVSLITISRYEPLKILSTRS